MLCVKWGFHHLNQFVLLTVFSNFENVLEANLKLLMIKSMRLI